MKKYLILLALMLIMIAILGSYFTAYKESAIKMQILRETQERLQRAEEILTVDEMIAQKGEEPRKVAIVPRRKIDELISTQQQLIDILGKQNAKQ